MKSLLDEQAPPTAVFSANNLMTIGALRLLMERRVAIPDEMSIMGFDDLELSELLSPPLTVIDRATFTLGWAAAELLRARLATPDREQQHLILPVELVVRGSTAAPAPRSSGKRKHAGVVDRGPEALLEHTPTRACLRIKSFLIIPGARRL